MAVYHLLLFTNRLFNWSLFVVVCLCLLVLFVCVFLTVLFICNRMRVCAFVLCSLLVADVVSFVCVLIVFVSFACFVFVMILIIFGGVLVSSSHWCVLLWVPLRICMLCGFPPNCVVVFVLLLCVCVPLLFACACVSLGVCFVVLVCVC